MGPQADFMGNVGPFTAMIVSMQITACSSCGADAIVTASGTIHVAQMSWQCNTPTAA